MSDTPTIYVTANSPGEISGFLVPVVAQIRRHFSAARVVVLLLPCTFATGREEEVARLVPGVDEVLPARRIWRLVLRGLPYPATALVHLGGDLFYAALLARRWSIPTWGFQWAQRKWDRWMKGYFVKTEADAVRLSEQGIARERVHVIGDLVVDSVRMVLPGAPRPVSRVPDDPHIVFLPGSRRDEVVQLSRFFLEVSEHVRSVMPRAFFSMLLSPFIDWASIRPFLEGPVDRKVGGLRGRLVRDDRGRWSLLSAAGTEMRIVHDRTLSTMAKSDFVVSIPGTKTGEAGSLGKPMLILLPLNRIEVIPWHGLLGMLDWLPVIGRTIKSLIYRTMIDKYIWRVYSQPNIMGDGAVVPEMVGYLTPMLVSDKILEIFGRQPGGRPPLPLRGRVESALGPYSVNGAVDSGYVQMQADLIALYSPFQGAAERAVGVVADAISSTAAAGV